MRSRRSGSSILSPRVRCRWRGTARRRGPPCLGTDLAEFIEYGMWFQSVVAPDVDRRRVTHQRDGAGSSSLRRGGAVAGQPRPGGRRHRALHAPARDAQGAARGHGLLTSRTTASSTSSRGRTSSSSGGQSASSRRRSCTSTARTSRLARGEQVYWLHGDGPMDFGPFAPLFYAPTDVGPIGISRLVATPNVFRHVPRPAFDVIAARAIRPAVRRG